MGRLTKKKPTSKKKRKANGEEATPAEAAGGATKAVAAGETKKRPVPAPRKAPGTAKTPAQQGYIGKSIQFLREVKAELKKVTWPSRKQTVGSTVVVLILVMIVSLFLGMVDMGLSALARVVLQ